MREGEEVVVGSVDSGDIRRCRRSRAPARSTISCVRLGPTVTTVWIPGSRYAVTLWSGRVYLRSPRSVHTFIHNLCAPIVPAGEGMRILTGRSPGQCLLFDPVSEFGDLVVDRPAFGHQGADLLVRVHHGGVVAAAELLADLRQGQVGQLPAEVHGDLPRGHEHPGPGGPAQVVDGQPEVRGRLAHDRRGGDLGPLRLGDQ